jgi:2-oxoisovalerate dehydrogenase E2 component (dihydrolipoyl transacylase)
MAEFKLPDVGEGLTEAEIVTWKVKEGDTVAINDIVVEIETAKSLVELPSPFAGVVQRLMVPEGETIAVGTPIIAIGDALDAPLDSLPTEQTESDPYLGMAERAGAGESDAAPARPEIDLSNPAASGGGEGESLVGRNKADRSAVRRARHAAAPSSAGAAATQQQLQGSFEPGLASPEVVDESDEPAVPATSAPAQPAAARTLAKPPVRKLAKDLGIDLSALSGSGPNGTVTRDDVQAAHGGDPATSYETAARATRSDDVPQGEREMREPIKGVRKMMGQAMVDSAFSIPHVTEWVTIDATRTMEFVERLKTRREFRDVKVSPLLVLSRAIMLAMRRTPEINSWWDDAAQEVVYKRYVNLGIAAATPRGLVVPNVKDAEAMSLLELAEALNGLTATAREGKTQPAEMAGGTFTITNVGVFGVDSGTPIINPGESAILCIGAIKPQPWVVDGEIVVRQVTTLALSFDHRHIDGEKGSRFLSDVAGILEDPASALLF